MNSGSLAQPKASPVIAIISWLIVLWIVFVFLGSLRFKFSLAPETQHIFGTVGAWLGSFLGDGIGSAFAAFGSYVVGSVELLTSLVLLTPAIAWVVRVATKGEIGHGRAFWHAIGGIMASGVMAGAVFFHLFTPLGINVQGDGGSLFRTAVSVLVLGIVLFAMNSRAAFVRREVMDPLA